MTEVTIQRLGHLGDGVAEGPVFAPLTLPGEVVSGVQVGNQLTDIKVVVPSEHRVKPPCRHFRSCGGCQVQHASDQFVADWKEELVSAALRAQGVVTEIRPILTSPGQSRRRATLSARRTKKGATSGFHGRASGVIVEVPDCQLLHPAVLPALELAEELARVGGSRKGELSVTATTSLSGLDLAVTGGKPLDATLQVALAQLAQNPQLARLSWDGEVIAQRTPPLQGFGSARVTPPPGAFLQATQEGEADLLSAVRSIIADAPRIADLFAGCGTFALPLAEKAEVLAVEGDPAMVAALEAGWRMAQGLKPVTAVSRDLFRRPLMPDELGPMDAVVIDPPRAGAEAQVVELARSSVPVIAYVSCNPQSFARDAALLINGGYTLNWVQPVDQFRWSAHVELAASFTRGHMA